MPGNEKNVKLMKDFLDAFNKHDLEAQKKYLADDAVLVSMTNKRIVGKDKVIDYIAQFYKDAPKVKAVPSGASFATDEWGASEWNMTGMGEKDLKGLDLFGFKGGKISQLGGFSKSA